MASDPLDTAAIAARCAEYQNDPMPWRQRAGEIADEVIGQDVPALLARIAELEQRIVELERPWITAV